jgi:hypothetical protein
MHAKQITCKHMNLYVYFLHVVIIVFNSFTSYFCSILCTLLLMISIISCVKVMKGPADDEIFLFLNKWSSSDLHHLCSISVLYDMASITY